MSFAIDANILLYASDSASPAHARASEFLDRCARGREIVFLTWATVMAYLRISTHPGIFGSPLSPEVAIANVDALLGLGHVRVLSEQDGFWEKYRQAIGGLAVRGNLVSDAHIAALLLQNGVRRLYSNDADFRKFEFLEVRNPLK